MADSETLAAAKTLIEHYKNSLQEMLHQYMSAIDARLDDLQSQIRQSVSTSPPTQSRVAYFPPLGSVRTSLPIRSTTNFPFQTDQYTRPADTIGNQFLRQTMVSEMKPDPVLNAHDLVVSPTLMIAPSSKSDLVDLNTTATELVGKDEKASDPVSEVDESANLVGDDDVTMKLLNTDEVEPDLLGDDPIGGEGIVLNLHPVVFTGTIESKARFLMSDNFGKNVQILNLRIDELVDKTTASDRRNGRASIPSSSASAKNTKRLKASTFVKDRGKLAAVRSFQQLGCGAALRHDGYSQRQGGGCEKAWSRRVVRRRWQQSTSSRWRRRRDQAERRGKATITLKRRKVKATRSEAKMKQGGDCEEAWSRRVAKRRRWQSVAERTSPWSAAWLSPSWRVAMRRVGGRTRRGESHINSKKSGGAGKDHLGPGEEVNGAAMLVAMVDMRRLRKEEKQRRNRVT